MEFAIVTFVGLTGLAAMLVLNKTYGALAQDRMTHLPTHPSSPLDEAERILARRYARGEISPEEFDRMLAILRR